MYEIGRIGKSTHARGERVKRRIRAKSKMSLKKLLTNPLLWIGEVFWKSIPGLICLGVLFCIFLGLREILCEDTYFQITAIKVFPQGVLSSNEYQRLEKECRGRNLLSYDLKRIENYIKSNPSVRSVNVTKRLPNTVEVFITARTAIVQLRLRADGSLYLIDSEGVVMSVSDQEQRRFIILDDFNYHKKKLDLFERYSNEAMRRLPELLKAFKENRVTREEAIERIAVDHLGNFSIYLVNGPEIRMCEKPSASLEKLVPFQEALRGEQRSKIAYLNLCFNDVVIQNR